ncbi:MAG: DUF4444 domain-containing protein [Mangrovicoccus sp.]
MTDALTFPPLLWGEAAPGDAFEHACSQAVLGCEAGLVTHRLDPARMQAAMVFAPEIPLSSAMTMLPLCAVALQNALGALAPPEVAVEFDWQGGIYINGASCGQLRAIAPDRENRAAMPDWLVIGFTLPLLPPQEDTGLTPDQTALFVEGCADIAPPQLVEVWARYVMNWITRWEADGPRPLHGEWRGLLRGIGEEFQHGGLTGKFLGLDDEFGLLIRDSDTTHNLPLTQMLETL